MSQAKPNARTSLESFCEQYSLHPYFIPVDSRSFDEWDTLQQVKSVVENTNQYAQTLNISHSPITTENPLVQAYLWACGSYPVTQNTKPKWANPNYIHGDEAQLPRETREYHIKKAIELPTIKREEIAPRFNIEASTLSNYISKNGIDFRVRRTEAKRRIGRSIKTSVKWSDFTKTELAKIIPNTPRRTVTGWIAETDGQIPTKPENVRWL